MTSPEELNSLEAINSPYIPTADRTVLTYEDVYNRYLTHPLGIFHASQPPRFANAFEYDHTQMHTDLGDDVHPVEHGRYTHDGILVHLLNAQVQSDHSHFQPFTIDEIRAIKLASHVHDFGECSHPDTNQVVEHPPGDISYYDKLPEHSLAETAIRNFQRQLLFPEIVDSTWNDSEAIVIGTDGTFSTHAFDAVEHLGYYITGLRAGYLALVEHGNRLRDNPMRDDLSFRQLRWLGVLVSHHHRHRTLPVKTEGLVYPAQALRTSTRLYDKIQASLAPIVEAELKELVG